MKLVSFGPAGQERPGILSGTDEIVDIDLATGSDISSIRALLELGEVGLDRARALVEKPPEGALVSRSDVRLGPPVTNPGKIVAIGQNYKSHTDEQGAELPPRPLLFSKAVTALAGDGDPIFYPEEEEHVDYEVELAVVFLKKAFRVDPADWEDYVAGYTIVNDVSARDTQFGNHQWYRGKSPDSFCPMGPYLATRDEVPDPHDLQLKAVLNGEVRQDGSTRNLIFTLPEIIASATMNSTFMPGDVIATGTPAGVGIFMKPPACMEVGDEIVISVTGLGTLTNRLATR
jgi:2,4-diketo-3-deoxy-L-fuconate hydrolase